MLSRRMNQAAAACAAVLHFSPLHFSHHCKYKYPGQDAFLSTGSQRRW